jgi:hypothetical protein
MDLKLRPTPRKERWPNLELEQILRWADAHHRRTGEWPTGKTGFIVESPRDKWHNVDAALRLGLRGLEPGSSLARLLAEHRGVRNRKALAPYAEETILQWADAHHARTGQWPTGQAGPVQDAPGETWTAVDVALTKGHRGLPGGSSLAQLLAARRGVRNRHSAPPFSEAQILQWADAYYARMGRWPIADSGVIPEAPDETWSAVNQALKRGMRGLPGGSSLVRLLNVQRGVRNRLDPPPLTVLQIVAWADAFRARTGRWPGSDSGRVEEAPAETWTTLDACLRQGKRGLPGGSSLARLLAEHRGRKTPPRRQHLTLDQILAWADAYYAREGRWPSRASGAIADAPGETWMAAHMALSHGHRGLPGGSSLAELLALHRGVRNIHTLPTLTEALILEWADRYHQRTGEWPKTETGSLGDEAPGETWNGINRALYDGHRGLPGGSSLARLLAEHRGVRNTKDLPPLTVDQVLAWADGHHARTGRWPSRGTGTIRDSGGETWAAVDACLRQGKRGLPGGSSLARLLAEQREVMNRAALPNLVEAQILAWADAYRARHQRWPGVRSGTIPEAPDESWAKVDNALKGGFRGLPGNSSLLRLLQEHRQPFVPSRQRIFLKRGLVLGPQTVPTRRESLASAPSSPATRSEPPPGGATDSPLDRLLSGRARAPRLNEAEILAWADAHYERLGEWPTSYSGVIPEFPRDKWLNVDAALRGGLRGLPGDSSLAQLLAGHRGVRNRKALPRLTEEQILGWADAYFRRTGRWPRGDSGPIVESPGETWTAMDVALTKGLRGLPGGSSLPQLLAEQRGVKNRLDVAPLTEEQILAWADAHHEQTGEWPTSDGGPIAAAPGETWTAVDQALRKGTRSLPRGSSLVRLLEAHRGARNRKNLPRLTEEQILQWADAYHARTGRWPTRDSGAIEEAPAETWSRVNAVLDQGSRGLPGGSSLARLFAEERGVRNHAALPDLSARQILEWADAHHARHGCWPQVQSGPIDGASGETWSGVNSALQQGHRGLPGGSSLHRLLEKHRKTGIPPRTAPRLRVVAGPR